MIQKIIYRIKALRLFSLPLSFSGIVMGGLLANSFGNFSWALFILAIITASALHLICNLANDVGDYQSGNDTAESVGHETMLISGKLSVRDLKLMIGFFTVIAALCGLALIYLAFGTIFEWRALLMIFVGVLSLLAAIFYTIGKKPYGYRAFGDLAVFLFFGLTAVAGTFFLLTKTLPAIILLPSISMGFFVTGVVNLNNIRDIENDRKYRKTIPIFIGEKNAKHYHALLVGLPFILMLYFNLIQQKPLTSYLYLILFPFTLYHILQVYNHKGLALNRAIGCLILITNFFVISVV